MNDTRALSRLLLPAEVTPVERRYLARLNRVALTYFLLHFPVLVAVAFFCGTGPVLAGALTALALVGPVLAYVTFENPRRVTWVYGVTSMFMGALLVHFGKGPMQIEMHFYFFVSLALLAVFANPVVILLAACTVATHHVLLYFLLPSSVFNYQASLWAVAVHALFVCLESAAGCFVARSFYDNVVGLEKVVEGRTAQLDAKNRDLRLVLEHVDQGLLNVHADGTLSVEQSRILQQWVGPASPGVRIWEYLGQADEAFGGWLRLGWESLTDGFLPEELALSQLPSKLVARGRALQIQYKAIHAEGRLAHVLVIVTDITGALEHERGEERQREAVRVFEHFYRDRAGFTEFLADGRELLEELTDARGGLSGVQARHALHTLKGNCGVFGLLTVERACHELETRLEQEGEELDEAGRKALRAAWDESAVSWLAPLAQRLSSAIEVDETDYLALVGAVQGGAPTPQLLRMLEAWIEESTEARLGRVGLQAKDLAERLGKAPLDVVVEPGRLRLPHRPWAPFWSSLMHVVRNAVDHGIEDPETRVRAGKPASGQLTLRAGLRGGELVLEVADDGRGIDWAAVAQAAQARGLPCESEAQRLEALFADGLSTREVVTELSGRGVGMGAVRAACRALGGRISVTSRPGLGTTFTFVFPAPPSAHPEDLGPGRPTFHSQQLEVALGN